MAEQSRQLVTAGLRRGLPIADALKAAGVPERTWSTWKKLGEEEAQRCWEEGVDPEPHLAPYVEFIDEAQKARAEGAMLLLERIFAASVDDWRAGAWLLERSMPLAFGRRTITMQVSAESETIAAAQIDASDGISLMAQRIAQIEARRGAIETTSSEIDEPMTEAEAEGVD